VCVCKSVCRMTGQGSTAAAGRTKEFGRQVCAQEGFLRKCKCVCVQV